MSHDNIDPGFRELTEGQLASLGEQQRANVIEVLKTTRAWAVAALDLREDGEENVRIFYDAVGCAFSGLVTRAGGQASSFVVARSVSSAATA